jgi:hypothetical protein
VSDFTHRRVGETADDMRGRHARERADAEASWKTLTPEQLRAKLRALEGHPMRLTLGGILATAVSRHVLQLAHLLPPDFLERVP